MKKIWQIPYSDKRDRCASCLVVLRKLKFKSKEYNGYRFTNVCEKCRACTGGLLVRI